MLAPLLVAGELSRLECLTDRARGFVQAAQTIAMRESHQRLAPAHLLKALMDDEEGFASSRR